MPTDVEPTPYVGRRVALLDRENPVAGGPGSTPARAGGAGAHDFGDDTMERVLGALEPVDQTTSFEGEPTERIPFVGDVDRPAGPARPAARPQAVTTSWSTPPATPSATPSATPHPDVSSSVRPGADPTVEPHVAPSVRPRGAGRRRAARRTRRSALVRSLPSVPAMLGLAALAASVGGTLVVQDAPTTMQPAATAFLPDSLLTGANDVGRVGSRGGSLSRDAARAADGAKAVATANGMAQQRSTKLAQVNQQSEAYEKVLVSNQWITPVTPGAYHLTARFGQYGLWATFHTGLDFAAPTGTPIHAIASGTILSADYEGAYGNRTIEQLADGTTLWYCHQNEFAVQPGDTVTQGEVIGYVGSTGHTTGPHVHIEVHPDGGDPVDPFPEFQQHGITP